MRVLNKQEFLAPVQGTSWPSKDSHPAGRQGFQHDQQTISIRPNIPLLLSLFTLLLGTTRLTASTLKSECEAMNHTAVALLANERPVEAEAQLSQLVSQLRLSADNKLCLGMTLSNLAFALQRIGNLDAAEPAALRSIDLFELTLGPSAPELCYPLRTLAQIVNQKGHRTEAAKLLARVEALPAATPSDSAVNHGLRAILLEEQGKLAGAELAYRQSIAEWGQVGRGASPEVVPELGNLASLYIKEQRTPEALPLLERALRITETTPCDASLRVGTLAMLASAHSAYKDRAEAEIYFRRAIDLLESVPPGIRAQTGRKLYASYSLLLQKSGRKREAKQLTQRANALFGPDPSRLTVSVDSLVLSSNPH